MSRHGFSPEGRDAEGQGTEKKWNGSHWIRPEKRAALYERDNWQCAYCGRGIHDHRSLAQAGFVLTLDHLTPRSKGGSNEQTNLVTACATCNSSRGNRTVEDYAPAGAQERIAWLIAQPLDIVFGKALIASLEGNSLIEEAR